MTPDDLIAAFGELAQDDRWMRIDRTKVGDADEIRLAGWHDRHSTGGRNVRTKRRFEKLARDAAAVLGLAGEGDAVTRWLWFVWENAPDRIEADRLPGHLGYAIADGERVAFLAETIPNAASASRDVVRRCRALAGETVKAADERTETGTAPAPPSDEAFLSPKAIAKLFKVDAGRLRSRLKRWRASHLDQDWIENTERKPREDKYLYRVRAVQPIIDDLRARSAKRPPNDRRRNPDPGNRGNRTPEGRPPNDD